jgi:hypothetical protein
VAQDFWRIADDAGAVTARRTRDAGAVRRINRALGRAADRRRALGLHREPLTLAAAAAAAVIVAALLEHALGITDDFLKHGLGNRILSFTWPALSAVLLLRAARAVRDPYGED